MPSVAIWQVSYCTPSVQRNLNRPILKDIKRNVCNKFTFWDFVNTLQALNEMLDVLLQ